MGEVPDPLEPLILGAFCQCRNAVCRVSLSSRLAPRQWKETRARLSGLLKARHQPRQIKWSKIRPEDVPANLEQWIHGTGSATFSVVLGILGRRP
jgi:hypothetical protein